MCTTIATASSATVTAALWSWVRVTRPKAAAKYIAARRVAAAASNRSSRLRLARTRRVTHMAVLISNNGATTHRGASVCVTIYSGSATSSAA